jgi:hypothetical protein
MVNPTMLGMIIEARDQVRMTTLLLLRTVASTRFASFSSTNGPFFIDLDTRYPSS